MTVTRQTIEGALVALLAAGVAEHIGLHSMTVAFGFIAGTLMICGFFSFLANLD